MRAGEEHGDPPPDAPIIIVIIWYICIMLCGFIMGFMSPLPIIPPPPRPLHHARLVSSAGQTHTQIHAHAYDTCPPPPPPPPPPREGDDGAPSGGP